MIASYPTQIPPSLVRLGLDSLSFGKHDEVRFDRVPRGARWTPWCEINGQSFEGDEALAMLALLASHPRDLDEEHRELRRLEYRLDCEEFRQ